MLSPSWVGWVYLEPLARRIGIADNVSVVVLESVWVVSHGRRGGAAQHVAELSGLMD
jgi:hypothetical protein